MNVSLTPELAKFVETKLKTGRYQSASEVMGEALRLLEDEDRLRNLRFGEVRHKIQQGLEQLNQGERLDGESVFSELRQQHTRVRRNRR